MTPTPEQLLNAYAQGYFPMALAEDDPELYWFCPELRGVMPLDDRFNIPRGLARAMRKHAYRITLNQDFAGVIAGCAEITPTRDGTWINPPIIALYTELHRMGYAHSVEVWGKPSPSGSGLGEEEVLIGGLYGIALGGAFFGESMFSRAPDASKCALVALVEHLRARGYTLLDTQYVNDHLQQFGILEVPKAEYLEMLEAALAVPTPRSF